VILFASGTRERARSAISTHGFKYSRQNSSDGRKFFYARDRQGGDKGEVA